MLRSALIPIATALAVCLPGAVVLAGYSGPHAGSTVAEILKAPKDDSFVLLRGAIVRKVGRTQYVFSDGTGEIGVKIKAKRFPAETVDEKTRVEITGEVETSFRKAPEIDVDSMQIIGPGPN